MSEQHRVFAVDLRGFGDSAAAEAGHDSATAAEDLVALIDHLDVGPVHLAGQDISGPTTFRVAATRPELVKSYTAIETGLPGFGFEMLADVTSGGGWHIGVLIAPGIPEMLLSGREREFIADYAIPSLNDGMRVWASRSGASIATTGRHRRDGRDGPYATLLTQAATILRRGVP